MFTLALTVLQRAAGGEDCFAGFGRLVARTGFNVCPPGWENRGCSRIIKQLQISLDYSRDLRLWLTQTLGNCKVNLMKAILQIE